MDLQALTLVKLSEHRRTSFDAATENEYYEATADQFLFARTMCKTIAGAVTWLRAFRPTGWRTFGRVGAQKASTG